MSKKQTKAAPEAAAPQGSKKDKVVELLRREGGATLTDMTDATGWLPHSTRAVLTGIRKKGFTLGKEKVEGVTRYSIASEPTA